MDSGFGGLQLEASIPVGVEGVTGGGDQRDWSGRASWKRGALTNTEDLADQCPPEFPRRERESKGPSSFSL